MRMVIALLLMPVAGSFAQLSSAVSLSNGVQLRISTTPTSLEAQLQPASGKSFYHVFRDENDLAVFAYEVVVDRTPDGEQFRITAKPAGSEFSARFPNADGGKPTPTVPEALESPLLASGGRFTVDIPTNPGLGENVIDSLQIVVNQRGAPVSEAETQAAQLRFADLKVYINGELASPSGPGAIVLGRYTMFYLPGRGGYFFSTEPMDRRGFVQIGSVDRTNLQFTLENENYASKSDAQILVHSAQGQLWIYHDPNYKPAGNWTKSVPTNGSPDEFFAAASDSLNWWLP
jgi:hypothetical protein